MASKLAMDTAKELFTNGSNDVADRLVLMGEQPPWSREAPRNLGGWNITAVGCSHRHCTRCTNKRMREGGKGQGRFLLL